MVTVQECMSVQVIQIRIMIDGYRKINRSSLRRWWWGQLIPQGQLVYINGGSPLGIDKGCVGRCGVKGGACICRGGGTYVGHVDGGSGGRGVTLPSAVCWLPPPLLRGGRSLLVARWGPRDGGCPRRVAEGGRVCCCPGAAVLVVAGEGGGC